MKVENPLMSRFAHGTLAHELVFRRTPRGHTVYPHFKPVQPNSTAQQNHHILFHALADRWNHLTDDEKDYWQPVTGAGHVTAYNTYLGYNLYRLNPAQPANLIGWWPNLIPSGEVLHDLTGNRNDGDFVNLDPDDAWPHAPQRLGQVIRYDGTGYVNVPTPPSTTGAYTWAFWFKQDAYTGASAIVDTGVAAHYAQCRFSAQRATHHLRGVNAVTPQMFLTDFTWHHYAGTWDTKDLRIYIDAVLHDTQAQLIAPATQVMMWFGIYGIGVADVHFRGQVDDLRFYGRCLELPDVAELAAR